MPSLAPQPLQGVRVTDLTWLLASAGTTTILASLGAEVIRLEWPERLDFTRSYPGQVAPLAVGKREVPIPGGRTPNPPRNPNRGGLFNDRNPGKLGITLNMNHSDGRELFKQLVEISDVVVDGFTAPTMGRWGFDYDGLRAVKSDIIYMQQSGFGNTGPYRDYVSVGPVAHAMPGLAYLNGLPDPHPPTMWNHSYMDSTPPYYAALAVISAIYYRNRTGKGQHIDQAQYQPGLLLTGTSVLDYSANQRPSQRIGNQSPGVPAAPHGVYRCLGDDAWVAIAVFNEEEWQALCQQMGDPSWCRAGEFSTLEKRIENQEALDPKIEEWTQTQEKYPLMYQLQEVGVRAGAVQSPQDKFENDPHLKVRDFFVHLDHSEMGVWPFTRHFTPKLSLTPAHPGGTTSHGAPCVGEDNSYVFEQVLGLTSGEVAAYEERGVI